MVNSTLTRIIPDPNYSELFQQKYVGWDAEKTAPLFKIKACIVELILRL